MRKDKEKVLDGYLKISVDTVNNAYVAKYLTGRI